MDSSGVFLRETTTMSVYKYLKNHIITGDFRPGEWIRERELKEMLGVSSTPIREALRMLVQERILVSVPHKGVRVKNFSVKELQDFYELRSETEGLAAELAANRRTEQQLLEMERVLKNTERELDENVDFERGTVTNNNMFHDLIARASHNQSLFDSLSQMRTEVNLLRVMSWNNEKKRPRITLEQHRLIFDAIASQDCKLARKHIQNHIWDSANVVIRAAKSIQD